MQGLLCYSVKLFITRDYEFLRTLHKIVISFIGLIVKYFVILSSIKTVAQTFLRASKNSTLGLRNEVYG